MQHLQTRHRRQINGTALSTMPRQLYPRCRENRITKKLPHAKSETASFYYQFSSICVKFYLATFSSHFTIASITPMEIKHTIKKIAQQ